MLGHLYFLKLLTRGLQEGGMGVRGSTVEVGSRFKDWQLTLLILM